MLPFGSLDGYTHHCCQFKSIRRVFPPTTFDAVFVEIGSSEEHWGRADAAEVWANVLTRYWYSTNMLPFFG